VLLAACGGPSDAPGTAPWRDGPPAQADAARRALDTYAGHPTREFVFARDAYPAADGPPVVPAAQARWLNDQSEVLGVQVGPEARAYPVPLLAFHHAVNDVLGGAPIAVTYCVVCSSGVAYDAEIDGRTLTFGMDGAWRGVATLYDRETRSVWLHLTGACIEGPLAGRVLRRLPAGRHTTWADWRTLHPDTTVMAPLPAVAAMARGMGYLSEDATRSGRPGYPEPMRPTLARPDRRLAEHALLFGVRARDDTRAYPLAALGRQRVVQDTLGGQPLTVWFDLQARSAAAYVPRVGGRPLTFRWSEARGIRDVETGSAWTLDGRCTDGPLAGSCLEAADGRLAEWYGWVAHHPGTTIWDPAREAGGPTRH
jgi:hypothetical protein